MNPKADINKIIKDIQASAREFAHYGLAASSKALGNAAGTLTSLGDELNKRAERFASAVDDQSSSEK